jgi:hypothetical protein
MYVASSIVIAWIIAIKWTCDEFGPGQGRLGIKNLQISKANLRLSKQIHHRIRMLSGFDMARYEARF